MNLNYSKVKHKIPYYKLLPKYEKMFYGTIGKYIGSDYTIDLKENTKPYHAKLFPIPIL